MKYPPIARSNKELNQIRNYTILCAKPLCLNKYLILQKNGEIKTNFGEFSTTLWITSPLQFGKVHHKRRHITSAEISNFYSVHIWIAQNALGEFAEYFHEMTYWAVTRPIMLHRYHVEFSIDLACYILFTMPRTLPIMGSYICNDFE